MPGGNDYSLYRSSWNQLKVWDRRTPTGPGTVGELVLIDASMWVFRRRDVSVSTIGLVPETFVTLRHGSPNTEFHLEGADYATDTLLSTEMYLKKEALRTDQHAPMATQRARRQCNRGL